MAGVIDEYVAALRRDLDFDPALARRMADEVEAHLLGRRRSRSGLAVARRRTTRGRALRPRPRDRRAIRRRCGDRQARRSWIVLLATVAVTFVARALSRFIATAVDNT